MSNIILGNYYKWHYLVEARAWAGDNIGDIGITRIDGYHITATYAGSSNTSGSWDTAHYNWNKFVYGLAARIGIGNHTYTKDSYALAQDQTSNISSLTISRNFVVEGNKYKRIFTITGTAKEDMTITEIGISKNVCNTYDPYECLMAIAQLDTPITLTTGESFSVKIEWIDE